MFRIMDDPEACMPGAKLCMRLRYRGWKEAVDRIITGLEQTIANQTVTYDFARLMDGAHEVKCFEFGHLIVQNMEATFYVLFVSVANG